MVVTGAARRRALVSGLALAVRLAVVAWGHARFPAVEDGHYYDVLARRLASGAGYTWLWPDGAVTYAAHYPVGYPALVAAAYALFGVAPGVAMTVNAVVGAAAAWAAFEIVDGPGVAPWRPLAAGLVVALHPALVPYTAAMMTEGVTAALLVVAAAFAARARRSRMRLAWMCAAGAAMGVATLVRPQSLVLAPVFGALALGRGAPLRQRARTAAIVTAVALACVAPWTARNCVRMHRCAMVSVNAGWNLLIGAQTTSGAWAPVAVPSECATVWDEAGKDACFARAARRAIAAHPVAWLARAPAKLGATFDYFGAAPWYLHASSARDFDARDKQKLGAVETLVCRLLLLGALVAAGRHAGPRPLVRRVVALAGAVAALSWSGWIGYAAFVACVALLGPGAWWRAPVGLPAAGAVTFATAVVHAVFFGAGRYGLVVVPFIAAAAFAPSGSARALLREDPARRTLRPSTPLGRSPVSSGHVRLAGIPPAREESPSSTEHDAG